MSDRILLRFAIPAVFAAIMTTQGKEISWHTVDCGGVIQSTGGDFVLSGTLGQHDAGSPAAPMTGGAFALVGGFWPGAVPQGCGCPGDLSGDNQRNGLDIGLFTECLNYGGDCVCADVDGVPGITTGDITVFVDELLAGASCQ